MALKTTPKKRSPLGQGYESIFLDNTAETGGPTLLRVTEIEPCVAQPRTRFDEEALASLAESLRENGMLQPVVVRSRENGFYELVAGERRWRAAKLAGLREIPAVIIEADDKKTAELSLIENVQREDLNPVELARGYRRLLEEFSMTQEEIAASVGRSRPSVANALRLLDLPEEILSLLEEGRLSEGHGKVLLSLRRKESLPAVTALVLEKGLSVRGAEELVRKKNREDARGPFSAPSASPEVDYIALLEQKAAERLGRVVKISGRKGARRLELSFTDDRDLETLLRMLCGQDLFEDL